jgi:hypothetical protein
MMSSSAVERRSPRPHVIVREDGPVWRVSVDGVPHSAHATKEQAIRRARELAKTAGAELLVVSPDAPGQATAESDRD